MKNKRLTIALGAILISIAIISSGCVNETTNGFHVISEEARIDGMIVKEVVDKNTGVHYYVNTGYQQGFMCPVYNSDGTVRVDKED